MHVWSSSKASGCKPLILGANPSTCLMEDKTKDKELKEWQNKLVEAINKPEFLTF